MKATVAMLETVLMVLCVVLWIHRQKRLRVIGLILAIITLGLFNAFYFGLFR